MNINKLFCRSVAALMLATAGLAASAQEISVSDSKSNFPIVADGVATAIVVDKNADEVVSTIASAVAGDIEAVTGVKPTVANSVAAGTTPVIAGTIGSSELIDGLIAAGKLDVSGVDGQWEAFGLQVVENPYKGVDRALVCFGQHPRSTAYALFELSKLAGVSPWIWWADVTPVHRDALYIDGRSTTVSSPSVKYRGIFINDEDWGFQPWAANGLDKQYKNVGPNAYAKVMELLLRLRANTLWPAMHLCSQAFWDNKDNLPMAKRYEIVLGSSHCEQMLRDNEWEWRRYEYNDPSGVYSDGKYDTWNYNSDKKSTIQQYWRERVEESKGYQAMYTLGMRGVHDWAISGYPSVQDKVNGLTEIIGFQRSLLNDYIGDPTTVPQIFIPYKEVLEAYNAGLNVPEDVTLTWVDDNHGYIRQLPRAHEQARSGGNGVYYHVSYWGTPHDYLWLCSHSPAHISYELSKAYDQGVRNLWIINVGDIKPAEAEMQFAMELGWDVEKWNPIDAHEFTRYWAAQTFGEDVADEFASIKNEYYRLAQGGKPEHIFAVEYTTEEMNARLDSYKNLAERVDALKGSIRPELADAYYQLLEYPVKAAYNMNQKVFLARESLNEAKHGQRTPALAHAKEARTAYNTIDQLTQQYNTGISDGKWNRMMSMKPRGLEQFNMPAVASLHSIAKEETPIVEDPVTVIPVTDNQGKSPSVKLMEGLGLSGASLAVWPVSTTAYAAKDYKSAPSVKFNVPVMAGDNVISARFLPTFPLNTEHDLRVALSVNGEEPEIISLKTVATEGKWNNTVLQGFNDATVTYNTSEQGEVSLTVYLLDPALALSDIYVKHQKAVDLSLTRELIENYDFELNQKGEPNTSGATDRGIPFGWKSEGELKGNSFGINNDAANPHGTNICWINSTPMPSAFTLYQTIPAAKLEPGTYRVSCRLWLGENKKANCRLFANNNVQYYGYESDYNRLLTPGEINTYAGYAGQNNNGPFNLMDMSVEVKVGQGEDLTLGIKSGNRRNDGTAATDNSGWFKVDYFTIERVDDTQDAITDITADPSNTADSIYSLQGIKQSQVAGLAPGIYIINGVKTAVR